MEQHHLPANSNDDVSTPTVNASIISRFAFIFFVGIISIFANHEASKGFAVTVINEAGSDTLAGKRFSLFFQSNDKATRIILTTSKSVESILYPFNQETYNRKKVNGVVLRFGRRNLSEVVEFELDHLRHEFTLHLSHALLLTEQKNFDFAVYNAVLRGMARVWLWDGNGNAPPVIMNAMVEYISSLAGFMGETMELPEPEPEWSKDCLKGYGSVAAAKFLSYCEQQKPGFVRRLNEGMRNFWHDGMVDAALGMPAQHLCSSYYYSGLTPNYLRRSIDSPFVNYINNSILLMK